VAAHAGRAGRRRPSRDKSWRAEPLKLRAERLFLGAHAGIAKAADCSDAASVRSSEPAGGSVTCREVSREWGDDATRGMIGRVDSRLGEHGCDGCCG
jgi:hypothetical protein